MLIFEQISYSRLTDNLAETKSPSGLFVAKQHAMPHIDLPQEFPGERELIAAYTSGLNECKYCANTHGAIAKYQLNGNGEVVKEVMEDPGTAQISPKLKTLLDIAAKVQQGGREVTPKDIGAARAEGATDREIHDAVLIAVTFCMFNRYVDGLGTWAPEDPAVYEAIGKQRASEGYLTKPFKVPR